MSKNEYQEFLTMFKNIDNEYSDSENDENKTSLFRRLTSPRGSVSSIGINKINSNIRTKFIFNPDSAKSDNVNENNFSTSVSFVQQPNPKESINAARKMNSIQDQNTDDSGLDSLTASSNNNVQKYNITNLLKHIYSLKSINPSLPSTQSSPSLSHSSLNSSGQNEQQSNTAKQFWMPDEQVKECFQCNEKFTTFRRRHHCRVCGQIFCAKCSDHEIPSQLIWPNTNGNIRACKFCHSFVGEIQTSGTADLKQNSSSIKELMTRLSLPTSSFYSFSSADNKSTPDTTEATTPTFSLSSFPSTSSLSQSAQNTDKIASELSDDSNPFDVTENKDYLNKPQSNESELKQLIINNSSELRNLWVQLYHTSDGIQFQTKSINKFKKVYNSISGKELVNWLMKSKSVSKDQAIVIGQALMHGKWLECSYQQNPNQSSYYLNSSSSNNANLVNKFEQVFYDDNTFYKPGPSALNYKRDEPIEETSKTDIEEEPDWIKELNKMIGNDQDSASSSSSQTNLREAAIASAINDHEEEDQKINETITMPLIKIETKAAPIDNAELINQNIHSGSPSIKSEFFDMEQKTKISKSLNWVNDNLQKIHRHLHLEILKQMLKLKNLSFEWFDIVLSLASQCVDLVRPDVKHDNDSMDIRSYIKIKKLLSHEKSQSRIVNGLVFSKNLAHKNMNSDIKTPKVLLLKSPIEYFNRTEDKMCSLESIYAAESQYLKNYCSKLLIKYQPDILVVEKSVARIAQEIFLQSNVSLVLNAKSSIMDKLSRFLQADPMYSIDDPIKKPKLGFCTHFHIDNYQLKNCDEKQKSLMFFEGTPTNLGCTVLLCGPNENELKIVKSILKFMIYVIYNSKLEASFIMDKYADFDFENTIYESILKNDDSESNNSTKFEADIDKLNQEIEENLSRKPRLISESQPESITESKLVNPLPISIEQSPLEESNKSADKSELEGQESKSNLKLEICEQHKEKNTINLNRNFKLLIDDLHLSCSPFIKFKMPYLLIENTNDQLKKYLPENYMNYLKSNILLLDSHYVTHSVVSPIRPNSDPIVTEDNKKLHEFLLMHLTKSFDDLEIKKLYADYKSRGGVSVNNNSQTRRLILKNIESFDQNTNDENQNHFDCLDIFNRQQLAVLYVSQCETSPLYPNICQKPRIINMKFYSENDMTLGSFLARNCFRNGYKCPNDSCGSLIVYHTRSFVHGDTKITIRMSIVPSFNNQNTPQIETPAQSQINKSPVQPMSILSVASLLPKSPQNLRTSPQIQAPVQTTQQMQPQSQPIYDDINIFMWSVCKICNRSTKKVAMSPDTWSFSLAKFLELTLHTQSAYHQFNPDSDHECKHSLFSDNYQYFRFKNIVTVFSASKITIKKLFLPEAELKFFHHAKKRDEYINEIKDLYEKGLSQYSTLIERLNLLKTLNLSDKQLQKLDKFINQIASDYTLKSKIEKINLILTNNLHDGSTNESPKEVNYTLIDLLMIDLKKYLANFSIHWNNKIVEFFNNKKTKSADDDTSANSTKATQSSSHIEATEQGKLSVVNDSSNEYGVSLLAESTHDYEDHMAKSQAPSAISIGKRLIANLIPLSAYQPLKIPFIDDEHYLLSTESSYYVNEKYLSSIVSFTLSSKEYKEYQLNSSKLDIQKFYSAPSQVQQDIDEFDPSQKQSKTNPIHFELQFSDSTTKFYCKAYHAELFSRLRKLLIPNEEDKFINSLFRCVNWEAKGGKSNSQFRKTLDNRFILKEMSKQEVASFIDFAPQYINYLIDSIENKKASCMAKIYGAYRICMMKNSTISSSKAVKIDIVVMENLFVSNKKSIQIFDLKGSERNRLIQTGQTDQSQNQSDNVLLDENFLRWSFDNPIYVKPHSKYVLMKAIENDSKFLSSKYIMDYSLLCGIDMETNEINVGLIDYLRAFTWDKKVETYIKSTIGGAQGKMPTIVSPEIYKTRFINAIDRYFQQVPDQWSKDNLST